MRPHSVFDPSTGLFTGNVVGCSADQLEANVPAALRAMPGRFDHRSQRVDIALLEASRGDHSEPIAFVVDHQPPQPSPDHEWHAENPDASSRADQRWRWKKKPEVIEREMDEERARRALADLDAIDRLATSDRLSLAERATLQRFRPLAEPAAPSPAGPAPPIHL